MSRATLVALAEVVLPEGRILSCASEEIARRTEAFVHGLPSSASRSYFALLTALDVWSRVRGGTAFAALSTHARLDVLASWESIEIGRAAVRALTIPLKLVHFGDEANLRALRALPVLPAAPPVRARWSANMIDGSTLSDGEELECDVVVVGTGAGGAAAAAALAKRGHGVLLLEEGAYVSRGEFSGRPVDMMRKLYRASGATVAFGNTIIPIPLGRGVGGTTLVNAGTCFRVPEATLAGFRESLGLTEFTPELLAPYYDIVERELEVGYSSKAAIGRPADVIARGCDALGYSHGPLLRNAPGCDGQGLCCFGCPTDAKRSTNVSFVPTALLRGAHLVTGLSVTRVLLDNETAVGVLGELCSRSGQTRTVRVRAKAVVLACGSLHTPNLLLRQGIANASGELGRNLSIHPAAAAVARFDEPINASSAVPQGYSIDHFAKSGLMFEGAQVPLELTAAAIHSYGRDYVEFMERFDHTMTFGFMVKDTSRGRVHRTREGEPRVTYWLNETDFENVRLGLDILCRVFLAAGAREVLLPVAGQGPVRSLEDVERLRRTPLAPRHVDLSAYHPLGTARMGRDPFRSVVGLTHETHDIHNLFVCDGSAVPGALGVNPQMTIMAMALRAAEFIDRRLERLASAAA